MAPVESKFYFAPDLPPREFVIPKDSSEVIQLGSTIITVKCDENDSGSKIKIKDPEKVVILSQTHLGDNSSQEQIPSVGVIDCGVYPFQSTMIINPDSGKAILLQHRNSSVIGFMQAHKRD